MTSQNQYSAVEQEQQQRSQALSPVSPKPIHFPSPSNIPILENQMDSDFDDTSAAAIDQGFTAATEGTASNQGNTSAQLQEHGSYNAYQDQSGSDGADSLAIDTNPANAAFLGQPPASASTMTASHEQPGHVFSPSHAIQDSLQAQAISSSVPEYSHHEYPVVPAQGSGPGGAAEHSQGVQAITGLNSGASAADIQALLNSLTTQYSSPVSAAPGMQQILPPEAATPNDDPSQTVRSPVSSAPQEQSALPGASAGLPPRPPTQSEALGGSHQAVMSEDIRKYHPHLQAQQSHAFASPTSANSGGQAAPVPSAGAPGTNYAAPTNYPPPPAADFQQNQLPMNYPPGTVSDNHDPTIPRRDLDKWGPEMQRMYDKFLEAERLHVQEGQWEKFPKNSRLFVGNLSTERVTKRDLFHVFHRHGRIAQISIKQAYGFIQYFDEKCCIHALQAEQGIEIRDKKVHLEISKPQKDKKPEGKSGRNRRSRSPDNKGNNKSDRFRGRGRDDYRPGRDSPPRRDSFRNDRYDGNRRSRSRSPYDRNSRYRSRSPKRIEEEEDASLPLPRRDPASVPDVQVLARDDPPQRFLNYIESSFKNRGIKCDVLILSPRLNSKAVMRRQILEGVLATMDVTRRNETTQTFNMTLFNRSAGHDKINFDEYQNQPMNVIVELVLRAQKTHRPPPSQAQTLNPYGLPLVSNVPNSSFAPPQQTHQRNGSAGELSNMLSSMDASSLQQLLGRMQQSPQAAQNPNFAAPPTPQSASTPFDLSRFLGSASNGQQPQQQQHRYSSGPHSPTGYGIPQMLQQHPNNSQPQFQNLAANPALAGLFGNVPTPSGQNQASQRQTPGENQRSAQSPGGGSNINDIMEALTKYQR